MPGGGCSAPVLCIVMYYTASIQYNLGLEIISNLVYIFIFASFGYQLANIRHSQITSKLSSLIAPIPTRVKRTSIATPLSLAGGIGNVPGVVVAPRSSKSISDSLMSCGSRISPFTVG